MPRVAYCDHSGENAAKNFIIVLENRGNQATHIYLEDPVQAYNELVVFRPNKVVIDLFFEKKDEGKDCRNWWGCRIIDQIKNGNMQNDVDIWILSKYLSKEVKKALESNYGILEDHLVAAKVVTWKQIAERIGA